MPAFHFCTISTVSHLFKAFALADSLLPYDAMLHVLVTDSIPGAPPVPPPNVILYDLESQMDNAIAPRLVRKYSGDALRWGLKPVYLKHLLGKGYESVIYVDNDIFFYASPAFLFEKLKDSTFLLTPHFYKADPRKDQNWLEANFRVGLYNAGFIGASVKSTDILDWWAQCCLYNVKKSYWRGMYDDQKYLDLVPVIFDQVEIVKHRGCNFAGWNSEAARLEKDAGGQLLVNGDPLIFIHFAPLSVERFSIADSPVSALYVRYLEALDKYSPGYAFPRKKRTRSAFSAYFYYLQWKFARLFERE